MRSPCGTLEDSRLWVIRQMVDATRGLESQGTLNLILPGHFKNNKGILDWISW